MTSPAGSSDDTPVVQPASSFMNHYFDYANEELDNYMEGTRSDMGLLWFDAISMVFDPSNYVSPPAQSQLGSLDDPSSVPLSTAEQAEPLSTDTSSTSPETPAQAEQSDTHSPTEQTGTTSPSKVPCANIVADNSISDASRVLHQTHCPTEPSGTTLPSTVPRTEIITDHSGTAESPVLHQTPSPMELSKVPSTKIIMKNTDGDAPRVLTISSFEKELFGTTSSTKILCTDTDVMKKISDTDALPVLPVTPSKTDLFCTASSTKVPTAGVISDIKTTDASPVLADLPSQTEQSGTSSPVKPPLTEARAEHPGTDAAPILHHTPSPATLSGTSSPSKVPLADVMAASPNSDAAQLPQHNAAAADQRGSELSSDQPGMSTTASSSQSRSPAAPLSPVTQGYTSEQPGTSTAASSLQSRSPAAPPIPVTKGHKDSESQTIKIVVVDGFMQTNDLCCSVCGSENIVIKPVRPRQNTTSTDSCHLLKSERTENVVSVTSPVSSNDEVDCGGETGDLNPDTLTTEQNNIPIYTVTSPIYTGNEETRQFELETFYYPPDNTNKRPAPSSPDNQSDELGTITDSTGESRSFRKFKRAKRESRKSDELILGKREKRRIFGPEESKAVRTVRKRTLVDNLVIGGIGDCETSFKRRRSERRQYGGLFGPLSDQYLHESDPNPPIAIPAYANLASTLPRPVDHSRTHQVTQTPCYAQTSFSHSPCDLKTSAESKSHTVTLSNFFTKAYTDLKSSSESKPHTATLTNFFAKPTTFLKTCEPKPHTVTLSDFTAQSPTSAGTEETEHHESQAIDCLPSIKQEPITPEPTMQEFTQNDSAHENKPDVYAPPRYYMQFFTDLASVHPTELVHEQTTYHNTDYTPARQFDGYLPPCASLHAGSSPADSHTQQLSEWEEEECDLEVDIINETYEAMEEVSGDETTIYSPVTPSATPPDTDNEETVPTYEPPIAMYEPAVYDPTLYEPTESQPTVYEPTVYQSPLYEQSVEQHSVYQPLIHQPLEYQLPAREPTQNTGVTCISNTHEILHPFPVWAGNIYQ